MVKQKHTITYTFDGDAMTPLHHVYLRDPAWGTERRFDRGAALPAEGLAPETIAKLDGLVAKGFASVSTAPKTDTAPLKGGTE